MTVQNSALRYGKISGYGAGVFVNSSAIFNLENSEIYSCRNTGGPGGGIYNSGTTTINNSAIYSNYSNSAGGGINSHWSGGTADNDSVKYFTIRFQGKTYKTDEPKFTIPNSAKSKISQIIVTVFDRAENKKSATAMLKIKKN